MIFRKKGKRVSVDEVLEQVRSLRDLINVSGNFNPSDLKNALRMIADATSKLDEVERDKLARAISDMFDEKVSIRKSWKEDNVRKIKSLLKEISMAPSKKDPAIKSKIMRAKQLDMQIKMDDAIIEAMLQTKEILIDTIRRGMEPTQAWASIVRVTSVLGEFVEGMNVMKEEYESTLESFDVGVQDMMKSYGLEEEKEEEGEKDVVDAELKEMIEKYGSS